MTGVVFDTHAFVKRLKDVGFTEQQAEVFAAEQAALIENRLATKLDLKEIELKIEQVKADIEQLRADLQRDLKELEYRMTIKLGTLMVVAIGVVATLVKLL